MQVVIYDTDANAEKRVTKKLFLKKQARRNSSSIYLHLLTVHLFVHNTIISIKYIQTIIVLSKLKSKE